MLSRKRPKITFLDLVISFDSTYSWYSLLSHDRITQVGRLSMSLDQRILTSDLVDCFRIKIIDDSSSLTEALISPYGEVLSTNRLEYRS